MAALSNIERPVIRYHGGKWMLAPWIIEHFPAHRTYVEPFCGAASVLLRKSRAYAEIINDLDSEIVNLFRVLRDPAQAQELERLVRLTPFAREEFELSYDPDPLPVEQARRTILRSFAGFGSNSHSRRTGFRASSNLSGTSPALDWSHWPDGIRALTERLSGVVVENRPALEVIKAHDTDKTLYYVDPPYLESVRRPRQNGNYRHEMSEQGHIDLAQVLRQVKGYVAISGYPSALYDDLYQGWARYEHRTYVDSGNNGSADRTEVLWCNYQMLQMRLFDD